MKNLTIDIKENKKNKKGKLATGALVTVFITTLILVPTTIFIDRNLNEEEVGTGNLIEDKLYSYGFNDSIYATGNRQDEWMGIKINQTSQGMEETLLLNNNYVSVDSSEDMINGVKENNGIGYLPNSSIKDDEELDPLAIPFVTETGEAIWIDLVSENPKASVSEDYIHAPLNVVMKVPAYVAVVLKQHMFAGSFTPLNISDLNATQDIEFGPSLTISKEEANYGDFLIENNLQTTFALSFILFNYIIYSNSAHASLAHAGLTSPYYNGGNFDEYNRSDSEFKDWIQATFGAEEWGVINATGIVDILVDGTGTDEYALNLLMDSFSSNSEVFGLSPDLVLVQQLENKGSYTAWETTDENNLPPGVVYNPDEYDSIQNGRQGAFLGTQSRGIKQDKSDFNENYPSVEPNGEISYWGYKETAFNGVIPGVSGDNKPIPENDFIYNEIYFNFLNFLDLPLAATIATENIAFFTTTDLMVMNYETGLMQHPQGLTKEGYKAVYQNSVTWDALSKTNQIYWG